MYQVPISLLLQLTSAPRMEDLEINCSNRKFTFSTAMNVSPVFDLMVNVQPAIKESSCFCYAKNWKPVNASERRDNKSLSLSFTVKGGVLADEMGLGKTLTLLSLIVNQPRKLDAKSKFVPVFGTPNKNIEYVKTTLVICPSQLVAQWGEQIALYTDLKYKCCTNYKDYTKGDVGIYDILIVAHSAFFSSTKERKCPEAFTQYGW